MNKEKVIVIENGKKYFYRFTFNQRVQHIVLAISVIVLVLTGMPLKFHDAAWAHYLYAMFGGIKVAPWVHKVAGSVLLILFVYHVIYLIYVIYKGQVAPLLKKGELTTGKFIKLILTQPLLPNFKDALDIIALAKYLCFISNERPKGDAFTWKEKFDYWAPFWGVIVIGLSGLIMWNKELATIFLPGEAINLCLIAHGDEALLAALFLFIWHWYNVHFSTSVFPMGTVFITGYMTEELMAEEHYEYYEKVMKEEGYENEILPPHGSSTHKSDQGGNAE